MAMEQDGCNICEEAERKIQSIAGNDNPLFLDHNLISTKYNRMQLL